MTAIATPPLATLPVVDGWHLGGTVAHLLVDRGTARPAAARYVSRCGALTLAAPRPAADRVPACRSCQRVAYAPTQRRDWPYLPGDRATVLHNRAGATVLAVLRVAAVTPIVAGATSARWRVEFEPPPGARVGSSVTVGRDGRDRNHYVEPVSS